MHAQRIQGFFRTPTRALGGGKAPGGSLDPLPELGEELSPAGLGMGAEKDGAGPPAVQARRLQEEPGEGGGGGAAVAALELVRFGEDQTGGEVHRADPFEDAQVHFPRPAACVDEDRHSHQRFPIAQVFLDQRAPAALHCEGNLGVAITGEIDEAEAAVDPEKVDELSLSGGGARFGKIFPVQENIDEGGFSDVAPAGESNLGRFFRRPAPPVRRAGDEFGSLNLHRRTRKILNPRQGAQKHA